MAGFFNGLLMLLDDPEVGGKRTVELLEALTAPEVSELDRQLKNKANELAEMEKQCQDKELILKQLKDHEQKDSHFVSATLFNL